MKQQELNIQTNEGAKAVGDYTFEPIRSQPMLHWIEVVDILRDKSNLVFMQG